MLLSLIALMAVQTPGQKIPVLDPIDGFAVDGVPIELSFAGNKTHIRVGTENGQYGVWDLRAKRFVKVWYVGREIRRYLPSPAGRVFTIHADSSVALRNGETGEVIRDLHLPDSRWKPDKRSTLCGLYPGPDGGFFVVIWDHSNPAHSYSEFVYITSDGRIKSRTRIDKLVPYYRPHFLTPTLVAVREDEKTIAYYNPLTGKQVKTLKVQVKLPKWWEGTILFSPDQRLLAVIPDEGPIYTISARTGKRVAQVEKSVCHLREALFSNNGKLLLFIDCPGASLYHTSDGKRVASLSGGPDGVACFSPDDTLVAIGVKKKYGHSVYIFKISQFVPRKPK